MGRGALGGLVSLHHGRHASCILSFKQATALLALLLPLQHPFQPTHSLLALADGQLALLLIRGGGHLNSILSLAQLQQRKQAKLMSAAH